ncbi:hypothetical protein ACS0TY_013953 [Phlomoides rotata]
MGNCSLRAVTDSTERLNEEVGAIRSTSSSVNSFKMKTMTTGSNKGGNEVWKVKLVIDHKDLEMILSEEVNTEALIERMRIAAKSTPIRGKTYCNGFNRKLAC